MQRLRRKSLPEVEERLPVDLAPVSNGEFFPLATSPRLGAAERLANREAGEYARRAGTSRRKLLAGLCGTATVLLTLNQTACATGGAMPWTPRRRWTLPAPVPRSAEWRDAGAERLPAFGPRSRREVLALWRSRGGRP